MTRSEALPCGTVHLVGCDAGVRCWIAAVLAREVGAAIGYESPEAFVAALPEAARAQPACAVVDFGLKGIGALGLLRWVAERRLLLPLIFLVEPSDVMRVVAAARSSAFAVIGKPPDARQLRDAVRRALVVRQGGVPPDDRDAARQRVMLLSPREMQVFRGLSGGLTNKAMANHLGLSVRTVEDYRARMLKKIGAAGLADAVRIACLVGLEPLAPPAEEATLPRVLLAPPRIPALQPDVH